jgi:hypothetical protein
MNYPAASSGVSNPKVSCNSIAASGGELTPLGLKESLELPASSLPKTFALPMGKQIGTFGYFWPFGSADFIGSSALTDT